MNANPSNGCFLVPLRDRTHIDMRGSDRASFLHNLCTNDVKRLEPGEGCEAFVTDVRGKTIGHILVFCGEDRLAIETEPNQSATLLPHFDKYLITEDIEISDETSTKTDIALFSENSEHTLTTMGLPVPIGNLAHAECLWDGSPVAVRRLGMMAMPCFLIQVPNDHLTAMVRSLNDSDAVTATEDTFESLRVTSGWPRFGLDFSRENLPQELNRDQAAISFTKGCYLGQETVARIDALGHVNRQLVGLAIEGKTTSGTPITVEGQEIGKLTSVVDKREHTAPLANATMNGLAILRAEHTKAGTKVSCGNASAEVVALPT